ncbi:glycosyltransferase family 2 protein [Thalassospira sp.]|uniref:glycosyltransferase family 2 protein n=1 Tax=Thalassospira sp. TaxID=1912094 RepID=UPI000C687210|nr:glycosyltransferase family 2 protein [Thalassospira sp.]MBC07409.1 glycosyl transferase family 2 [Thalassospira sp.]|tara:strand:+ start:126 stop:1058 length:933 start_codon:yes stop_codon:yes gene_type:complete
MQPEVSFVLPVYNKGNALPYFFASLLAQTGDIPFEVVFVDDVSTDNSLEILDELSAKHDFVRVISNTVNAGPSIRLNQGAEAATGKYLALFDCDEILAPNALEMLLSLAKQHDADMVHGHCLKTSEPIENVVAHPIDQDLKVSSHENPLERILGRGMVRMTWLIRRDVFIAAGGCDEKVFVQDESLPLRLSIHAKRLLDTDMILTMVPDMGSHLSSNKLQQNHDRFLVYLHFLKAHPELPREMRMKLYQKCVSALKKARRDGAPFPPIPLFLRYVMGKLGLIDPDPVMLESYRSIFQQLSNIRRIEKVNS